MSATDLVANMDLQPSQARADAKRFLEICNACRYCETYCAVFPAMTLQRSFSDQDMDYFANLCHNCKGCFQACQFAPPHEFGINLPKAFAEVRNESYANYAWPSFAGSLFEKNGMILSLMTMLILALTLVLTIVVRSPSVLFTAQIGEGAFYRIIPWDVLTLVSGASFVFSGLAITISLTRFWRATQTSLSGPLTLKALIRALHDVATLRYLGNDGHGCNDLDDSFTSLRRNFHHLVMYGFLLCFAATTVATIYDHVLGLIAPYSLLSLPVILGSLGGLGLVIGCAGLVWIKIVTDPQPVSRKVMGGDYAFITLLMIIAITGLALLMARATSAMGILFAIHLGAVLAFFVMMPYTKFVHGFYRGLAVVKAAIERDRNKPLGE
jgi:citrate/tricarballylate utilization protein